MRVLWFTVTSGNYQSLQKNAYDGGGWIRSLQSAVSERKDLKLGIAFHKENEPTKVVTDRVIYYPLAYPKKLFSEKIIDVLKWKDVTIEKRKWKEYVELFNSVVKDFKPDIIEFFGTEFHYGLLAEHIEIPCIVHIQGIITPCLNAYFPPGFSLFNYCLQDWNPHRIYSRYQSYLWYKRQAFREQYIYAHVHNYMGRTKWDKHVTSILNPQAKYFYCGEILRDVFYEEGKRLIPKRLTITSTISSPLYKGYDLILKTAYILKKQLKLDFDWNVYGNIDGWKYQENIVNIKHQDVNVILRGSRSALELKNTILNSTCYFHPSYIDNSSNSVCEAQILGCPVVATNVGGEESLIEHGRTGYLIPANDPYEGAYYIELLYRDVEKNLRIGKNCRNEALIRHDKETIVKELINIYDFIIHDRK